MLPLVPIEPKPFPVEHNENETNVISFSDEKKSPILSTLFKQKDFFVQGVSGLLRLGFRNKVTLLSDKETE